MSLLFFVSRVNNIVESAIQLSFGHCWVIQVLSNFFTFNMWYLVRIDVWYLIHYTI